MSQGNLVLSCAVGDVLNISVKMDDETVKTIRVGLDKVGKTKAKLVVNADKDVSVLRSRLRLRR